MGSAPLPRPSGAFLDKNGFLAWTWYPQTKMPKGLGRKVASAKRADLRNPPLEEKGARLRPPGWLKLPTDLCLRFARLDRGSDKQIRMFAARWGPLGIHLRAEEHVGEWRRYAACA